MTYSSNVIAIEVLAQCAMHMQVAISSYTIPLTAIYLFFSNLFSQCVSDQNVLTKTVE